ncbi:transmembrane protein 79 [Sceloporus undulatus]|uniref:transmembrane protein 79 n=1 Tax=Sceloporus undulatus TaxID=8520 RepID=UPI001C4B80FE|nr:transmembrane protein 79 [Sceloporus undulatus]
MAAAAPAEEVAMGVLGQDAKKSTRLETQEESFEDYETTLLWGQSPCGSIRETTAHKTPGSDARPSPEGRREEAILGPAVDDGSLDRSSRTPSSISTKEEEEEESNAMPKVASHVFVPIDPHCIERKPMGYDAKKQRRWEYEETTARGEDTGDVEKQDFIPRGHSAHFDDLPSDDGEGAKACADRLPCLRNGTCSSANLKAVASMLGATIIFPCLVYGAYVFLPFDAPSMPTMASRLVYTLRCGVFATFPIIIGMVVYGVSRLCFSAWQPFGELHREVEIHRRYVSQSVHLFILYFFNIAVLSTYLPQEGLKLIPLLTALFAISRLLYWLAYAMGRSFRGFGFGLTFLPLVAMLLFNLYSMFLVDSESLFATEDGAGEDKAFKPRYWG